MSSLMEMLRHENAGLVKELAYANGENKRLRDENARLLEAAKTIRESDCGAWLKDCATPYTCAEGREKRLELMRALDNLYKAAGL